MQIRLQSNRGNNSTMGEINPRINSYNYATDKRVKEIGKGKISSKRLEYYYKILHGIRLNATNR